MIGDYLGELNNIPLLEAYVESLDFTQDAYIKALRRLLSGFRLPGEGQKVDRIMERFGEKYFRDRPNIDFNNAECIFILSYSVMML
jgi:brefeldin A-inhibited guanine nucleotide-exchange protein